jgi:hypothetical protein
MGRVAATVAAVIAAVSAVVLLNLLLLDRAMPTSDRIGRLSPKAQLPAAPPGVVRPQTGTIETDENDD